MSKNNSKFLSLVLPIFLVSFLLMSFLPIESGEEIVKMKTVEKISEPINCIPYANWDPVEYEVDMNSSGVYYVPYYDLVGVTGDPQCYVPAGCGYVDIDLYTEGFQCARNGYGFTAYASDRCTYIAVRSTLTPTQSDPVTHTINFRVMDEDGNVSGEGGRTLLIKWRPFVPTSVQVSPCPSM